MCPSGWESKVLRTSESAHELLEKHTYNLPNNLGQLVQFLDGLAVVYDEAELGSLSIRSLLKEGINHVLGGVTKRCIRQGGHPFFLVQVTQTQAWG